MPCSKKGAAVKGLKELAHSVLVIIMELCIAIIMFNFNVLKCKALKFKCICIAMCSLVMSPFSREFL